MSTMGYVTTLTGAEDSAGFNLDFEKQSYKLMEGGKQVGKNFADLVNFTRSTSGGRFNEKGLYESVPANQPRFDYDPLTKVIKGLLIEEQRTNMAPFSDRPLVQTTRASYVSTGEVFIDGLTQFKKMVEDTSNGTHFGLPTSVTVQPDQSYTFTYFLKAAGRTKIQFQMQNAASWAGSPGPSVEVDLAAKTIVGTSSIARMKEIGNGVFRVSISLTTKGAATGTVAFSSTCYPVLKDNSGATTYTGDGVSGMYIGGYQVEANGFETSYIPTLETFTSRASSATYFDKNGVLKTAGVNTGRSSAYMYDATGKLVPVGLLIETATTNLVKFSGMQSVGWSVVGAVLRDNKALAPDGTLTASLFQNSTDKGSYLSQTFSAVTVPHTVSFYVKPSDSRPFSVVLEEASADGGNVTFDAVAKTFTGNTRAIKSYTDAADGWMRVKVTMPGINRASTVIYCGALGATATQHSGYIWGFQIEVGDLATSYIPTTTTFTSRASTATYTDSLGLLQTAAVNVARNNAYEYDEFRTLKPIGLLLENASTNLLRSSQSFTGVGWVKSGTNQPTIVDNVVTAPDGTLTAGTLTLTATGSQDSNLSQQFTTTLNGEYTGSIYLKASTETDIGQKILIRQAGNTTYVTVTLTSAWQRIERSELANSGIGVFTVTLRPALAGSSGVVNVDLWGAQVEAGLRLTSYIPTTSSAATRAADVCSSPQTTRATDVVTSVSATRAFESASNLNLAQWYNQSASTFKVEYTPGEIGAGNTNLAFYTRSSTAVSNSLVIVRRGQGATDSTAVISRPDGAIQLTLTDTNSVSTGVRIKSCIAYKLNSAAFATQGRPALLDNTVDLPTPDWLFIGNNGSNSQNLNGHIHNLQYYPVRLPDSQVQLITV